MVGPEEIVDFEKSSLRERIRGAFVARVLIVTIFLGATALTQIHSDAGDAPLAPISALIVLAYVFSLASAIVVERTDRLRELAQLQVLADIGVISGGVLLTGGLSSPLPVWYNLAILGGAMTLFRRGAFMAAALSALAYGSLMNLLYYGLLPAPLVFLEPQIGPGLGPVALMAGNIGSFFSIAFLSSALVERLARTETALEKSDTALRRVEAMQQSLVQNLESAVLTVSSSGRIESANKSVESVLSHPAAELIGREIGDLLPALRPSVGVKTLIDASSPPVEMSYRPPSSDGAPSERTLRCRTVTLTDTYHQPIGSMLILQDISVLKSLERRMLEREAEEDRAVEAVPAPPSALPGIVGESEPIRAVTRIIQKAARTTSTILVTGESGTGKELAASAIHALSPRSTRPLVVVNCAAIPETLIESELFGHVRGAFTGAVSDRRGLFRSADGGSIFLDEIGDLPLSMQVKLLRVLQERTFTPVGGQTQVAVDVRIIAATNRNLEAEVVAGRFREDLYYRLNVIRIDMPPLRERKDDLPLLILDFVARLAASLGRPAQRVSAAAMNRLLQYEYPGNVRELENLIEHAVALSSGDVIDEEDLPSKLSDPTVSPIRKAETPAASSQVLTVMQAKGSNLDLELEELERRMITEALRQAGGVRKRAAEMLGINYRSLRHRLSKYGFSEEPERELH